MRKCGGNAPMPTSHCRTCYCADVSGSTSPLGAKSIEPLVFRAPRHISDELCLQNGQIISSGGCKMATIALVDDDPDVLALVGTMLESEGYHVVAYSGGAAALNGLKTVQPDLAILDIKMPQMDGVEVLRQLRQKSEVPIIFLAGRLDESDARTMYSHMNEVRKKLRALGYRFDRIEAPFGIGYRFREA